MGGAGAKSDLVLRSVAMLFIELSLIRWTGSNVLHLSFFSNFVLLGSFLGIGLGFLRGSSRANLYPYALPGLALFVGVISQLPIEIDRSGDSQLIFFGASSGGLPAWVTLPVIFVFVAVVMMAIGQGVARSFANFEPLTAYRLDIGGSILGSLGFAAMSFTGAPPIVWFSIGGLMLLVTNRDARAVQLVAAVALVGVLIPESFDADHSWSPYYKVETVDRGEQYGINVNGIPHQVVTSVEFRREVQPFYFIPYEQRTGPAGNVLIIGAGSGTDVAVALASGATHIDAVEIDPRIQEIGADRHPDAPYSDDRVDVHIDDGRAFLERTDDKYDTILFALPDSLTLVSGQSALRLESYLFTSEAIASARDHLAPGGVFSMYNFYRETWLIDRLAGMLSEQFGAPPCLDLQGTFALMLAATDTSTLDCETIWSPINDVVPDAPTDDRPFLYLQTRTVPEFYLVAIAMMLAAAFIAVRLTLRSMSELRPYGDLFFMGVAFLLLETKGVGQQALLFGTTWLVNATVFIGVLATVYLAVEIAERVTLPPRRFLYGALFLALLVAWLIPPGTLLDFSVPPRLALSSALMFTPILIANLIFADRFRETASSTAAFGANLIGAMVGGTLEYAALLIGFQHLMILVALAYLAAMMFERRSLVPNIVSST